MSAPLSIADLARLANDIVLTPVTPRMSLLHAGIEYKGFSAPPTFLTKPSSLAGYGINIAKMGNPFPLQPTDKLSIPLQPDEELIDALTKLAASVASQVEKDRAKVRSAPFCSQFRYTSYLLPPPLSHLAVEAQP